MNFATSTGIMKTNHTNRKQPTNLVKKLQHAERVLKKKLLNKLQTEEWNKEKKHYADQSL